MKQISLLLVALCFAATSGLGQNVIINFENTQESAGTCFGAGALDGSGCISVIANPDASGINLSDSVAQYIEPAAGEPWMGVFFDMEKPVMFSGDSSMLCAKVWMPAAGTFTFKLENPANSFGHEFPAITNNTGSSWVELCQEVASSPADGQAITRMVFFFNIGSVPGTQLTHYLDEISQPGATGIKGAKFGGFITVYPNPVVDVLRIGSEFVTDHNISVVDITGREVLHKANTRDTELNVAALTPGVYFLKVLDQQGQEIRSSKFVKQ